MTRPLLVLVLLALGCGESIAPKSGGAPATAKPGAKEAAAGTPALPAPVADTYRYNPAGKRDPFQGFLNRAKPAVGQPSEDATPLQRWDVEKFTLKGVIWDTSVPRALLVDPDGLGHVVRVGTYVGRNWGKVSAISTDGVIVTEEYKTLDGELVVDLVQIRFPGREI